MIVLATLDIAIAFLSAAGPSFFGLGAQLPTAEWGAMVSDGLSASCVVDRGDAGVRLMPAVMALNLVGDGLRDTLDPRSRR